MLSREYIFAKHTAVNTVPERDASQQVSDFDEDGAVGLYRCTYNLRRATTWWWQGMHIWFWGFCGKIF